MHTSLVSSPNPLPANALCAGRLDRRSFLRQSLAVAGGCACCLNAGSLFAVPTSTGLTTLISPGCRRSKVKVAKIYLGTPKAHWPTPNMDIEAERNRYEAEFVRMSKEFCDVEFVTNQLVTKPEEFTALRDKIAAADGLLVIHLSMHVGGVLKEILAAKKPTMLFAAPYSGHEWAGFGALRDQPGGENLECLLTSDLKQLTVAVRPFRAMHHLREAKLLNLTTRALPSEFTQAVAAKFGTEIKTIDLPRMLAAYESIDAKAAEDETRRWMRGASKIVEPPRDEILRSCRLALAFEKVLAEENATALTVDCYGSMYRKLPAFPCVGFVRLNDMGLAGICESDLTSGITFLLLQALSGRPGFISDPTVDESKGAIILAHCLGSTRMNGPAGPRAPYKLRTIMERQEGCVPQVTMRVGEKVTQGLLVGTDKLIYFTGDIIESPDTERGCRTKMTVKVDGDIARLWQNWSHGLHRVTCYGDVVPDLKRFCRFKGIELVNEA
jgi:L-arabinose isomerase